MDKIVVRSKNSFRATEYSMFQSGHFNKLGFCRVGGLDGGPHPGQCGLQQIAD
jgi:hypothetical protein